MRTAVVAGVGPGLGASLARRFADEGCAVGLFARSAYVEDLAADIRDGGGEALGVRADVADETAVERGFERVREAYGPVDVLVYHAEHYVEGGLLELSPAEFEAAWRGTAHGAFLCTRAAVPDMVEEGGGTVIYTGASFSKRVEPGVLGPGSAKFAVRGLAEAVAREFGPRGVHAAHVTIDGPVDTPTRRQNYPEGDPDEWLDPAEVARTYWHLVEQDRSAWTRELDLRPDVEDVF